MEDALYALGLIEAAVARTGRLTAIRQRDERWLSLNVEDSGSSRSVEILFDGASLRLIIDGGFETGYPDVGIAGLEDLVGEIGAVADSYFAVGPEIRNHSRRGRVVELAVMVGETPYRFFR